MGSIPVRVIKSLEHSLGGFFHDPYGNRTARPPIGGKQQSSGLLFSAGVPPCRNVYCGCWIMQPVRGIEGTRPPVGGKKEPGGLFFSVTGCGTQRLQRPLEGPCILLAAAPTTPPCFCRRQRSSLLQVPTSRNVYRGCCWKTPSVFASQIHFPQRGRLLGRKAKLCHLNNTASAEPCASVHGSAGAVCHLIGCFPECKPRCPPARRPGRRLRRRSARPGRGSPTGPPWRADGRCGR